MIVVATSLSHSSINNSVNTNLIHPNIPPFWPPFEENIRYSLFSIPTDQNRDCDGQIPSKPREVESQTNRAVQDGQTLGFLRMCESWERYDEYCEQKQAEGN
jgi:hypothetical protein